MIGENRQLGPVHTMDHEVVPCDLRALMAVELVLGQLRFTLEKKWQRDHGRRGPQNMIFKA